MQTEEQGTGIPALPEGFTFTLAKQPGNYIHIAPHLQPAGD